MQKDNFKRRTALRQCSRLQPHNLQVLSGYSGLLERLEHLVETNGHRSDSDYSNEFPRVF